MFPNNNYNSYSQYNNYTSNVSANQAAQSSSRVSRDTTTAAQFTTQRQALIAQYQNNRMSVRRTVRQNNMSQAQLTAGLRQAQQRFQEGLANLERRFNAHPIQTPIQIYNCENSEGLKTFTDQEFYLLQAITSVLNTNVFSTFNELNVLRENNLPSEGITYTLHPNFDTATNGEPFTEEAVQISLSEHLGFNELIQTYIHELSAHAVPDMQRADRGIIQPSENSSHFALLNM